MNNAKHKILTETFETNFSLDNFKRFTRELLNGPNMLPESRKIGIWREYDNNINAYYMVANYKDSDDNKVLVLAVELKRGSSVERARSMQRNFISKVLDANNYEGAIVAFYTPNEANWRLSLVRLDYTFTSKGVELDLTPAKRFSYLVGENEPNHTAKAQLLKIFEDDEKNPTLDELEQAFSVEKVTKDFFNEYKEKYLDLKEYLEENDEFIKETNNLGLDVNKFAEQFSKKLMGQLAFLYFLQKKGWLGVRLLPENRKLSKSEFQEIYNNVEDNKKTVLKKVFKLNRDGYLRAASEDIHGINDKEAELLSECFIKTKFDMPWGSGNRQFIREIFDFCNDKTELNFFNDYLEPFFYDALNKKRKNHYFKRFNCKIPFLNGGLFEPIEGYHWDEINFKIPNVLFSNKTDKSREADGILDVFDRYNFTMNEDEPLEKEVAIDPEMLGKIFENLLDVSDRKSKGAFYTPREIVHYMCQESLINYLVNKVGVPYDDIKEFILYGEMIRDADNRSDVYKANKELTIKPTIYINIVAIDEALKNVKVADPAVGSGAFPLGMLNEIVKARNNITEYIIRVNKEGEFGKKYDESFIRARRSEYKMKWETIKNSIFAVDIEPSAVDIAKLRLWLSVVVDQEIDANNPEPHPLPNLDQNIMVGNSLIDEFEGIKLFDKTLLYKANNSGNNDMDFAMQMNMLLDQSDELLDNMFKLQDQYFGEENEHRKRDLKIEIDRIRDELIRYKLQNEGNIEGLKRYEESLKSKRKPYFVWELEFAKIFKENGGFDIVIGNPPYVGEKGNKNIFREIANTEFGEKYYQGKMDLFYFFFHKAIDIGKNDSEISYITTNYFVTADSAIKLREDFKKRTNIIKIINFAELKIFETALGQHNMISILRKTLNKDVKADICVTSREGIANQEVFSQIFNWEDDKSSYYKKKQIEIYDTDKLYIRLTDANNIKTIAGKIFHKMTENSYLIGDKCLINTGVNTGCDRVTDANYRSAYGNLDYRNDINKNDGIFVISQLELDDLELEEEEYQLIHRFYKNSNIQEYSAPTNWDQIYLIYVNKEIDIKMYPNLLKHLTKYRKFTELKREYIQGKLPWYSLHWAREIDVFVAKDKIVFPYRNKKNIFAYCEDSFFGSKDILYIRKKDNKVNLKYLVALLNSKLYYYWLWNFGKRKGKTLELYVTPISEIPIKYLDADKQKEVIDIVDSIIKIIKDKNIKNTNKKKLVEECRTKIDRLIYEIYDITCEEIGIIESLYKTNFE